MIVTNNRRDLLKQSSTLNIHGGLIILIPFVDRDRQIVLFTKVLDVLASRVDDLVNTLVEVLADGAVHVTDWSSGGADTDHIESPD